MLTEKREDCLSMKLKVFALLLISTLMAGAGTATVFAQSLSLPSLIEEALQNNPGIKAARHRYEAARTRTKFLRNLDDPKLEYEYDRIIPGMVAEMTGSDEPMKTISISQEIPFPGKLFLRRRAADREAAALKEEYKEKENEIIAKVKETYFMLSLNSRQLQITGDMKILIDQLVRTLTNRYSLGRSSQQEVLKAQAEYARLDNELVMQEQEKRISGAMLKTLLNRSQDSVLGEPPPLSGKNRFELDRAKILALAREHRPELKAYAEMLRKAQTDYSLARQEYLPDFMLKYTREEKDGLSGEWAGMIGVTIPLWVGEKQNSSVREAKIMLEETRAEYEAAASMIGYEVESALARVEGQKKSVAIYETSLLPQAEAAFKAAAAGFEAGRNDFLDLLDGERMLLEFKMDHARAQAELEIAVGDLEKAVGTDLEPETKNE